MNSFFECTCLFAVSECSCSVSECLCSASGCKRSVSECLFSEIGCLLLGSVVVALILDVALSFWALWFVSDRYLLLHVAYLFGPWMF